MKPSKNRRQTRVDEKLFDFRQEKSIPNNKSSSLKSEGIPGQEEGIRIPRGY
jgi:hypothetical protein